jgi:pyruvate dehydrogenase E2 component (dihydrolipoamide acetyltransferase)
MAEVRTVEVPDIGDFTDVDVVEVLVQPGDDVAQDDGLVTLETDKASMDVPAPVAGVVEEVLLAVGDTASQGTPVARITVQGDAGAATEAAAPGAVDTATAAEASAGDGAPPVSEPPPPRQPTPAAESGDAPPYASPAVRRLARERGVDLAEVEGTGPKGRITKDDVERPAAAPAPAAATAGAARETERVELTRIQRRAAENLAEAWRTIPHVTQHEDADITELEAFRKQLNAEQSDVKVTMVALLLKASAATLDAFPRFASSLEGDELVVRGERHIGFAADTPNGLVVPVVHDVDRKGLLELAGELTDLSGRARAGKLSPKEMSGAVFTISSLGGIGGTGFTPIVNPPQVAILGAVRSVMRPVWNGTEFEPRLMLPLSLSYDHRVIDGAAAARFCVHLARVLGDLRRVLL